MDKFDRRWGLPYRGQRQAPFQAPAPRPMHPLQRPMPMQRPIQPRATAVPEHPTQVPVQPMRRPMQPAGPANAGALAAVQAAHANEVAALRREIERLSGMVAAMNDEKERQARALDEDRAQQARAPAAASPDTVDEIERAKERLRKDASREIAQNKRDLVRDFIEVLDDLDRALQAQQGSGDAPGVLEGVELVRKSFRGKLAQHGVELEPALGADFDPARHEAVSVLPVVDPSKDGMIVAVVREGYRMGDDVLRPARVVVARAS